MLCLEKNTNNGLMTSDEVLDKIYGNLRKRRRPYSFPNNLPAYEVLYEDYDSYEGRTYRLGVKYDEVIKVGDFLVSIGESSGIRMNAIGRCLTIALMKKHVNVEDFIKDRSFFDTKTQSVLFSYNGKLQIPHSYKRCKEISYVTNPSNVATNRNDDFRRLIFYPSTVEKYDNEFVQGLTAAIQCCLGLENNKTRWLKAKIELDNNESLFKKDSLNKVLGEMRTLTADLDFRIDILGESEFISTAETLKRELVKLERVKGL